MEPVALQNKRCGGDAHPFVAFHERMVADARVHYCGSLAVDVRIALAAVERGLGFGDGSLQQAEITHAGCAAGLSKRTAVDPEQLGSGQVDHRTAHLAWEDRCR